MEGNRRSDHFGTYVEIMEQIYRVSIKSFPDYKHLLQEKYTEYKNTLFLTLR